MRPHLHLFPDALRLGRGLARATGYAASPLRLHAFPDGESGLRVHHPAGADAVLVRTLHEPNDKLVEVLLAADALRRAGAPRVTLIAPYLPYMRQDCVFRSGEPNSQRVVGALLGAAFDRVLTIEAHLHRVRRLSEVVSGARAQSLSAAPAIAQWVAARRRGAIVVGPDAESAAWIRAVARRAAVPWIVGEKQRRGDRRVSLRLPALPPGVWHALLVDDIASSGATLAAAARALYRAGIRSVDAVVVHALIESGGAARLRRAGIRRLLSCDTIPHPSNAISIVALLAQTLRRRR